MTELKALKSNVKVKAAKSADLVEHTLQLEPYGLVHVAVLASAADTPVAFSYGEVLPDERTLVRVHSRCLYGDTFGSIDCDCNAQLRASWDAIVTRGRGVVIYLDQEGRGHGLLAKARGYALSQNEGVDSFAAYSRLHLSADARNYASAADLLDSLGLRKIEVMTNNPEKIKALSAAGLDVTRRSLRPVVHASTAAYVESKARQGHLV